MSIDFNFDALVTLCRQTHEHFQGTVARAANTALAARNWLYGWYIVEYEQKGADRAEYGERLIERLSARLNPLGIRGASKTRLKLYRLFYLQYRKIGPTAPDLSRILLVANGLKIGPTASDQSTGGVSVFPVNIPQALSAEFAAAFRIGWSHYVELLTIDTPDERRFYEIEASQNGWTVQELKRQLELVQQELQAEGERGDTE